MIESVLADAIRPFWMPGINDASGKLRAGLGDWFTSGGYQITQPTKTDAFVVDVPGSEVIQLVAAFAADINRLSTAAFETAVLVNRSTPFPRSTAWLLINTYYAGFFSAHAILRILGLSCSQLGAAQVNRINAVANLFGATGAPVTKGLYQCAFDPVKSTLSCKKIELGGIHESFWSVCHQRLVSLSNETLLVSNLPVEAKQLISAKLTDLAAVLASDGSPRGNWLSQIRNRVTYNHQLGVWYPYSGPKKAADDLFRQSSMWMKNPLTLSFQSKIPLTRFQEACLFLVAFCRVVTEDLHARCAGGDSFCRYGPGAFLRLLAAG